MQGREQTITAVVPIDLFAAREVASQLSTPTLPLSAL